MPIVKLMTVVTLMITQTVKILFGGLAGAGLLAAVIFLSPASGTPTNNVGVSPAADFSLSPVTLPVVWGDTGRRLIDVGAIDEEKFLALYAGQDELLAEAKILLSKDSKTITVNDRNAGLVLNLLWAFGLANQNPILTDGPMSDPRYGDPSRFASTGGWPLSKGNIMDHYSAHSLVPLTEKQQALVERVSKNIYRPCCGNSTYFPDCNHGMAMLGLLELMAANGVSEDDMYKIALQINTLWFPDTYQTIADYFQKRGVSWSAVDPKTVLGSSYSSSAGYQQVLSEVEPSSTGTSSCGVQ